MLVISVIFLERKVPVLKRLKGEGSDIFLKFVEKINLQNIGNFFSFLFFSFFFLIEKWATEVSIII